MKKYVLFSLFLLVTTLYQLSFCHASETNESKKASRKYDAELIVKKIKDPKMNTYSSPGILIIGPLAKELMNDNEKKFKARITLVNDGLEEFDEWTFESFQRDDKVTATLAGPK